MISAGRTSPPVLLGEPAIGGIEAHGGARRELPADRRQGRIAQHERRIVARDAVAIEQLARQIEAAEARILGEVAQDVGELQGVAQRQRAGIAIGRARPEHPHRQHADGAGNAAAVALEHGHGRRAHRLVASISMPSIIASNSARGSSKRSIGAARARLVGRLGRPA